MELTINEALALKTTVQERITDLKSLRNEVATKKRFFGDDNSQTEPRYDVKKVDEKLMKLEIWKLNVDQAIKQSNANTKITVIGEIVDLLTPLE